MICGTPVRCGILRELSPHGVLCPGQDSTVPVLQNNSMLKFHQPFEWAMMRVTLTLGSFLKSLLRLFMLNDPIGLHGNLDKSRESGRQSMDDAKRQGETKRDGREPREGSEKEEHRQGILFYRERWV